MSELTAVSLFGGVGGFDLALTRAGVNVTAVVEIDEAAAGVLADQFPHTTRFTDVTEVTGDQLRATGFVPERGIITAGWPCQGNSVAGARGGMADPRSGLWRHVVRLLAETRPRWFIGENVPGLLTVSSGDDIAVVRRDLAQLGYWWAERILDAQHFGVPQRRRRVVFVGCLGDPAGPVQVLLEPEGSSGHPAPSITARTELAATLTAGVARTGVSAPGRRQEDDVNLVVSTLQGGGVGVTGSTPNQQRVVTSSCKREVVSALTSSHGGPDDNSAQAGHLVTHTHTPSRRSSGQEQET